MSPRFNANCEPSASEANLRRELPVLFHLMDVSRTRTTASVSKPANKVESPPQFRLEPAKSEPPALPTKHADPPLTEVSAAAPPHQLDSATAVPVAALETLTASAPAALAPAAVMETPESPQLVGITQSDPAADSQAPTPRRSSDFRRKPKIQPAEDWFTTHGKYVALGFVLALLGTIYLARTGRRPAPSAVAAPHAHPGDASIKVASAGSTAATKTDAAGHTSIASAAASGSASDVSPAKLAETAKASPESKAELFPPNIQQLASQPPLAGTPAKADESLFPWANTAEAAKSEERFAARPSSPVPAPNPAATSENTLPTQNAIVSTPTNPPAPAPAAASAYSAPAPSGLAYPTTADYARSDPTAAPPPPAAASAQPPSAPLPSGQPAYPVTNYRSQFSPPSAAGGPPAGWSPAMPAAGIPPQYPSPENSARGVRNERTGSGLY